MHKAPPHIASDPPRAPKSARRATLFAAATVQSPHFSSPQRTCVGCKQAAEQGSLWRAVADAAGRLRFDDTRRAQGRGVYVHRQTACLQAALRGGFSRSLRRKVVVTDAAVLSELGLPGRTSPGKSGLAPDLLAASTPARVKNQDNHS